MDGGDDPLPRTRAALPLAYERWRVELAPGAERESVSGEWSGTLVLIESGRLEVSCLAGGRHTFGTGDLLALGWLPLRRLRNTGRIPLRLLAVRRCSEKR